MAPIDTIINLIPKGIDILASLVLFIMLYILIIGSYKLYLVIKQCRRRRWLRKDYEAVMRRIGKEPVIVRNKFRGL